MRLHLPTLAVSPLVLLLGCTPDKPGGDGTGGDGTDDEEPAEALVDDCQFIPEMFGTVGANLTLMETVARVDWDSSSPSAHVVYRGADGDTLRTTADTESGETLLLGLLPNDEVSFQVVADRPNQPACSEIQTIETGSLLPSLPEIELTEYDEAAAVAGFTFVPIITEAGSWVVVLDELGRYVWASLDSDTIYRTKLSRDHQAVLAFVSTPDVNEPGIVTRIGLDGEPQDIVKIIGAHTDFDELGLSDGGFVALGWEIREFEEEQGTRKLLGDTVELVSPTGEQHRIWSSFDEFEPDLTELYPNSWYPSDPEVEDWSHANAISYDAATDQVLISVARFDALIALDRATGERNWLIAPEDANFPSDADVIAPADSISWPHSVHLDNDGSLMVFNRHSLTGDECAQADRYTFDPIAGTIEHAWQYTSEVCITVSYLGEVRPLPDGNALVVWTTAGQVDQATPAGDTAWRVNTELGAAIGFSHFSTTLY